MKYAYIALGCAVALAGAFSAGRFSAPLKVETIEVVKVAFQDREVVREVVREVKAKAETRIVYRERVTTKDGTVTEREKEETKTKEDTVKTDDGTKVSDRTGSSETAKRETVTLRPSWRVGLQVGASLREPMVPIAGPLVLGANVEYRIAGGLTAGLWLNTFGAAGLGVSLEF